MTIETTLNERQGQYGSFCSNALFTQAIMREVEKCPAYQNGSDVEREAFHMIIHKLARLICGDMSHIDSWRDIEGYARLVREELEV